MKSLHEKPFGKTQSVTKLRGPHPAKTTKRDCNVCHLIYRFMKISRVLLITPFFKQEKGSQLAQDL